MVNDNAGSTNRSASLMCPPGRGKYAIISPNETMTEKQIDPIKAYPIQRPSGPPLANAPPVPKNNPVPIWSEPNSDCARSTHHTADGNHRDMSVFQLSLETSPMSRDFRLILLVVEFGVGGTYTLGIGVSFLFLFILEVGHGG